MSLGPSQPLAASLDRFLVLAGPTAVGKSEVALRLGELLQGEIISVDSMQVYRGLDIGTAKPNAEDRRRVPHHLLDVIDVTEPFNVAAYLQLAGVAAREILARGRLPIFVGGTGLYLRAVLDGLSEVPAADPALRAKLEATPIAELLKELAERDPQTFQKIDRQNPRRIIRAVEIIRLTGVPLSSLLPPPSSPIPHPSCLQGCCFALNRDSSALRDRTDRRVDQMFARGLVAETEKLLKQGLAANRTACQALGYRQVIEHLRGERSLAETINLVKVRTWQFARRQLTWFRHQGQFHWIDLLPEHHTEEIARSIASFSPT